MWVESVWAVAVQAVHRGLPWATAVKMAAWSVAGMVARKRAVQGRIMAKRVGRP